MANFRDVRVYEKVDLSECLSATGRKPMAVRRVYINNGDSTQLNYRSRLVAT